MAAGEESAGEEPLLADNTQEEEARSSSTARNHEKQRDGKDGSANVNGDSKPESVESESECEAGSSLEKKPSNQRKKKKKKEKSNADFGHSPPEASVEGAKWQRHDETATTNYHHERRKDHEDATSLDQLDVDPLDLAFSFDGKSASYQLVSWQQM